MDKKIQKIEDRAKKDSQSGGGKKFLGYELRADVFGNIFLVGRKKMGKTVVIKIILSVCLPKKIPVIVICPSLDTDKNWKEIIAELEKKGHDVAQYTGIINPKTKENYLETIMRTMEKANRADPDHIKHEGLKFMLILDDLGKQMRSPAVYQFLLKNRHEKCGVILSGQSMKNIMPDARQQIGLWCLFPKLNEKDLLLIYEDSDPPVSWEDFLAMYHKATAQQYSFLYFTPDGEFRVKFDPKSSKKLMSGIDQKGGFVITPESEAKLRSDADERTTRLVNEKNKRDSESWVTRILRELGFDVTADKYESVYGGGPVPKVLLQAIAKLKALHKLSTQ